MAGSVSALPVKIIYSGGQPSGLGEFVLDTDYIPSTLLQLSGAGELVALSSLKDVSAIPATNAEGDGLFWNTTLGRWVVSANLATVGESNDGSNIGTGVGIYSGKSGASLQFYSLVGDNQGLEVSAFDNNVIRISASSLVANASALQGNAVSSMTGQEGDVLTWSAGTWITSAAAGAGGGQSNTLESIGAGTSIVGEKVGTVLNVSSLSGTGFVEVVGSGNVAVITGSSIQASNINLAQLAGEPKHSVQKMQDVFHSTGYVSGGNFVSASPTTVDISGGAGYIRAENNSSATLYFFNWPASAGVSLPINSYKYIGVEYNAGSPRLIEKSDDSSWNYQTNFPLGVILNDISGIEIHTVLDPHAVGDHAGMMIRRLHDTSPYKRDERAGGLILGESGDTNRYVTLTEGSVWENLNKFSISAVNTGAGSLVHFYAVSSGTFSVSASQTQWPNQFYNPTGTGLTELGNNKYANYWVYLGLDNHLYAMLGPTEHNSQAAAEEAPSPTILPNAILKHAFLIGRITFIKNGTTAASIGSVYSTTIPGTAVTDHGNLAGLADNDHPQYQLSANNSLSGALTDVSSFPDIADNQVLAWDAANQIWIAETVGAETLGATGQAVLSGKSGQTFQFFRIAGDEGISVSSDGAAGPIRISNFTHITDYNNPHVVTPEQVLNSSGAWNASALQSNPVSSMVGQEGEVLTWSGSTWIPSAVPGATGENNTLASLGAGLSLVGDKAGTTLQVSSISGLDGIEAVASASVAIITASSHTGDFNNPHVVTPEQVLNSSGAWNASALQGNAVSSMLGQEGEVLTWSGSTWITSAIPAATGENNTLASLGAGLSLVGNKAGTVLTASSVSGQDGIEVVASASVAVITASSHTGDATIHFTEASIDHTNITNIGTNTHAQIDTHLGAVNNPHSVTPEQLGNTTAQWDASALQDTPVSSMVGQEGEVLTWSGSTWITSSVPGYGGEANTASNLGNGAGVFSGKTGVDLRFLSLSGLDSVDVSAGSDNTIVFSTSSHTSDATIHFTEGSIDHTAITNIGTNTHAQIDSHIASSTAHFTEAEINHTNIQNVGTNTHAQIDSHIASLANPHVVTPEQVFNSSGAWNASALQSNPVSSMVGQEGEVLTWSGSTWIPSAIPAATGENNTLASLGAGLSLVGAKSGTVLNVSSVSGQDGIEVVASASVAVVTASSHTGDATIHFTEGSIDHTNITNVGTNTHAQIDSHIASSTAHFTQAEIDHTLIQNIGSNSHATIDSHIASVANPHVVTPEQVLNSSGAWNASALQGNEVSSMVGQEGEVLTWSGSTWITSTVPGYGGEANTASNIGNGKGFFISKDGINLRFATLSGVDSVDVSADSESLIVISTSAHTGDSTIHFTEGSIDHTNITNIGTNSHATIDSHIASVSNPHVVTPEQVFNSSGAWNASALQGNPVSAMIGQEGEILTWSGSTWIPSAAPGAGGGEANTLTSIGAGTSLVGAKSGTALQVSSVSGNGGIAAAASGNVLVISASGIERSKSFSLSGTDVLTANHDFGFFRTNKAITVTKVVSVLVSGSSPSGNMQINHATDRTSGSPNGLFTYPNGNISSTTTGDVKTTFNDATIPADSFVWVTTDAASGTATGWEVTIFYTEDVT